MFPQSSRAYADMAHPEPWGTCYRCNFRYLRKDLVNQFDWRGTSLSNLHILVCVATCLDVPQEQERTILVGPDPIPVRDPSPGWQTTQAGFGGVSDILELVDGDLIPRSGGMGLVNNGGVLALSNPPSGYPVSDFFALPGGLWSNGGEVTVLGGFSPTTAVPVHFANISASQLLQLGGRGLPWVSPPMGSDILWNPGGMLGGPVYIGATSPPDIDLLNDGGVLRLENPAAWPVTIGAASPGGMWSNGGECSVKGGFTPILQAPIFFGAITAAQLLLIEGVGLPITRPTIGSGILWNPGGASGGPIYIA